VEKYAASGGWVGIESTQADGRLRIRVSDAGPGIPARARVRIFEAFERVSDGVAEGASGTGLGLAIARDLATRMGGTLVLENSEIGAAFILELPAPERTPVLKLLPPTTAA
jgi:signal transduction histidine kinase